MEPEASTPAVAGHFASDSEWEELGNSEEPSWYLDPLVAEQKRRAHLDLIARWTKGAKFRRSLKTDLFEEANGKDQIYLDLPAAIEAKAGMDFAFSIVRKCRRRRGGEGIDAVAADGRVLPFRDDAFDLLISTSTLDHFESLAELELAIAELVRVLEPGGRLVLTLDNPRNPLYRSLRWASAWKRFPFTLGYTPNEAETRLLLERHGLNVLGQEWLIHNPRGVSTLLFLAIRSLFRGGGDSVVGMLMRVFGLMEALPSRRYTACFHASISVKPRS